MSPGHLAGPFYGYSLHLPVVNEQAEEDGAGVCQVCGRGVTRVPGGQGPTWTHPSGAVVGDNFPGPEAFTTELEWAVRYGDGTVGDGYDLRQSVESDMTEIRDMIAKDIYDAEDYEPMALVARVKRTFVEQVTGWVEIKD